MEEMKGMTGRRVCGTLEAVFGGFLFLGAIVSAFNGAFNIFGFLGAVFIIVTGSLGIASKARGAIIGYMVTGIICAVVLGLCTIGGIVIVADFEEYYEYYFAYYLYEDKSAIHTILIVAAIIITVAFIVSVLGVVFACVPLCARNHGQDSFQFQRFNEPVGAVGQTPDYNYSNTGYLHTVQTQRNDYGNKPVGGDGALSNFNNSITAWVDTKP